MLIIQLVIVTVWSPPLRGAWIEISNKRTTLRSSQSRPPRGGRGLKFRISKRNGQNSSRPPRGGRGLKYIYVYCVIQ